MRGKDFEVQLYLPTLSDPYPAIRIRGAEVPAKGPDGGCALLTSFGIRGGSITFEGIATDTAENRKLLGLDALLKGKVFGQVAKAIKPRPRQTKRKSK